MLLAVISVSILSPPSSLDASRTHFCLSSPSPGHAPGHPGKKDRRLSPGHVAGPASLFVCALGYHGSCPGACHLFLGSSGGTAVMWKHPQNLELKHLVAATWTDTKTRLSLSTCHETRVPMFHDQCGSHRCPRASSL